jgi:hypothetical protein
VRPSGIKITSFFPFSLRCATKFLKLLVELGHLYLLAIKEWRIIFIEICGAYLEISALEHILH